MEVTFVAANQSESKSKRNEHQIKSLRAVKNWAHSQLSGDLKATVCAEIMSGARRVTSHLQEQ
jgi:hypothetical protein